MISGKAVILKYIDRPGSQTYLNIGSGTEEIAQFLIDRGKTVTDLDIIKRHDYEHENYRFIKTDILKSDLWTTWDVVIASHVMEHVQDTGRFLKICFQCTNDEFIIAVPPLKHKFAGGHVHLFNMGILMYNLALAGFDVVNGHFKKEDYNIIGIVKPNFNFKCPELNYDTGDIEILVKNGLLPQGYYQGMDGDLIEYNWF